MTGCRIGRIKLKGGAELRKLPVATRDEAQRKLVDHAAMVAGFIGAGDIAGFVVVGWAKDGSTSAGYHIGEGSAVRLLMLPSFVADVLRERMIETGDWG